MAEIDIGGLLGPKCEVLVKEFIRTWTAEKPDNKNIYDRVRFYAENSPVKRQKVVDCALERFKNDLRRKRFKRVLAATSLVESLIEVNKCSNQK